MFLTALALALGSAPAPINVTPLPVSPFPVPPAQSAPALLPVVPTAKKDEDETTAFLTAGGCPPKYFGQSRKCRSMVRKNKKNRR